MLIAAKQPCTIRGLQYTVHPCKITSALKNGSNPCEKPKNRISSTQMRIRPHRATQNRRIEPVVPARSTPAFYGHHSVAHPSLHPLLPPQREEAKKRFEAVVPTELPFFPSRFPLSPLRSFRVCAFPLRGSYSASNRTGHVVCRVKLAPWSFDPLWLRGFVEITPLPKGVGGWPPLRAFVPTCLRACFVNRQSPIDNRQWIL